MLNARHGARRTDGWLMEPQRCDVEIGKLWIAYDSLSRVNQERVLPPTTFTEAWSLVAEASPASSRRSRCERLCDYVTDVIPERMSVPYRECLI